MKHFLLLPILFFSMNAEAFFSRSETERALQVIDRACADSWCEKSFDLQFNSLRCSRYQRACEVTMTFVDPQDRTSNTRSCLLENMQHADDVIVNLEGAEPRLGAPARKALDTCIESFYSSLPRN